MAPFFLRVIPDILYAFCDTLAQLRYEIKNHEFLPP